MTMKTYMIVDENESGGYIVARHMPIEIAMALLHILLQFGSDNYTIVVDYCEEELNKRKDDGMTAPWEPNEE